MNHLLIGAGIPISVALMVYALRRRASIRFLLIVPLAAVVGGVWAVVPDIPRLLGRQALYQRLHSSACTDVFFWHYSIDRMEDAFLDHYLYRYMPVLNAVFILLALLMLAMAWHELVRAESAMQAD